MTIHPETKSWTWVLEQCCDECGFDCRSLPRAEIASGCRDVAAPWPAFLADPLARVRPRADLWSALEYGCHVRDVYRRGSYRLGRMLTEDGPVFDNWDQDETAVTERYDLQDPVTVARELSIAGNNLADLYETVAGDQWDRPGTRSDGSLFTVDSFGRYFLHDLVHHVVDVREGFAMLNAGG
ncbi:MAG TPA: DinB family protein [Ilumatobacteraceae bacterium]|nr:DinB family protein [Ilumatobacteraceae bacterium]